MLPSSSVFLGNPAAPLLGGPFLHNSAWWTPTHPLKPSSIPPLWIVLFCRFSHTFLTPLLWNQLFAGLLPPAYSSWGLPRPGDESVSSWKGGPRAWPRATAQRMFAERCWTIKPFWCPCLEGGYFTCLVPHLCRVSPPLVPPEAARLRS